MIQLQQNSAWKSGLPRYSYLIRISCLLILYLNTFQVLPAVFALESRIVHKMGRHSANFFKDVSLRCLFLDPHLTTHQSNIGIHLRKVTQKTPAYLILNTIIGFIEAHPYLMQLTNLNVYMLLMCYMSNLTTKRKPQQVLSEGLLLFGAWIKKWIISSVVARLRRVGILMCKFCKFIIIVFKLLAGERWSCEPKKPCVSCGCVMKLGNFFGLCRSLVCSSSRCVHFDSDIGIQLFV